MGSELDKLFRDKLKNMEQSPPPTAWPRVQRKVRSVPRLVFGLNIAAALLILILGFWNQWIASTPEKDIQITTEINPSSPTEKEETLDQETSAEFPKEEVVQSPAIQYGKIQSSKPKPSQPSKDKEKYKATTGIIAGTDPALVETKLPLELPQLIISEPVVAQQTTNEKVQSTVITYSIDEVNAKFLKKPAIKNATETRSKATTAQKISSIAVAIKNHEVGLGDLRQLKDELLAFDFPDHQHQNMNSDDK